MNKFYPEGVLFSRPENQKAIKDPVIFSEAVKSGRILEARASLCDFKHDLYVDMPAMKGVILREEGALGISDGSVRDIALISRVNHPVCFTVEDIITKDGAPLAVLSRKKAQAACMREFIDFFTPGDVIDAAVTHLEPFGAFCDIGCGIVALLPVDCISVSRIFHPKDRFFVGQSIKAVIKSKEADGKINLTHKELLGTWEQNAALFSQGETVSGLIRTVESYGQLCGAHPESCGACRTQRLRRAGKSGVGFHKKHTARQNEGEAYNNRLFRGRLPGRTRKIFHRIGTHFPLELLPRLRKKTNFYRF